MMAQLGFDTLAFVKRLAAAGMNTRQAEALAEALNEHAFTELATKSDLREIKSDLRELESRLGNTLTLRFGAMIAVATTLIVAIGTFGAH